MGDLQPGDLLFFDYDNEPAVSGVNHVAIYVGPTVRHTKGEVVEAYNHTHNVRDSSCSVLASPPVCERSEPPDQFTGTFTYRGFHRPLQLPAVWPL